MSTHRPPGPAYEMVMACFRHQHPEAYGRPSVDEGVVPPYMRYGPGENYGSSATVHEEPMGNGEEIPPEPLVSAYVLEG